MPFVIKGINVAVSAEASIRDGGSVTSPVGRPASAELV